jgi:HNH endonuclease
MTWIPVTSQRLYTDLSIEMYETVYDGAMIDEDIYEYLSQHKWYKYRDGKRIYARSSIGHMHRVVMKYYHGESILHVHHKDGNGLNNTRDNLKYVTMEQHAAIHKRQRSKTKAL